MKQVLKVFLVLCTAAALLAGCMGSTNTPSQTPTPSISYSPISVGVPPNVSGHSTKIKPLPASTQMKITLFFKLSNTQQQQLQKATAKDNNNQAPLGLDSQTLSNIEAFFGISKVTLKVDKQQTSASFTASASTVGKIFQTSFEVYNYKGQNYYAPVVTPKLPTLVVDHLTTVLGLESYQPPLQSRSSLNVFHPKRISRAQADCNSLPQGSILPQQIAHAYGYDRFTNANFKGQHMTIDLVEIDAFDTTDLANVAACVGYNLNNISVVTVDSAPQKIQTESLMDIQLLMELLQDVHIVVYQTGSGTQGLVDIFSLLDQSSSTPGTVVSVSIGGPEDNMPKDYLDAVNQQMQIMYNHHLSVFFASGDCAAFTDQTFGSKSVSFPASSPYVIGVGGTDLSTDGSGNRQSEPAWVNPNPDQNQCGNSWGTGGGTSHYFSEPSYQTQNASGELTTMSLGFRNVPDVSADATNIPVYVGQQWIPDGGTSAAAPIWAAGMALINQALIQKYGGFYYGPAVFYQVYKSAEQSSTPPFFNVTQGNNIAYDTSVGWNYPTGLGTPNLPYIYDVLASAASH